MAGGGGGGWVQVAWYSTLFRADRFEEELLKIAPVAMRYGATAWQVFRSQGDRYKFSQYAEFANERDWETYWYGEEFQRFRALTSGWYQVPVVPDWTKRIGLGALEPEAAETTS